MSYLEKFGSISFFTGICSTSMSTVYRPIGRIEPFTVTLSMYLVYFFISGVKYACRSEEMSRGTPYYLVAASSLAAMFTFGLR